VLARVFYIKTVYIDLSYVFQRKEVLFVVKFFSQAMDHVLIIYLPELPQILDLQGFRGLADVAMQQPFDPCFKMKFETDS